MKFDNLYESLLLELFDTKAKPIVWSKVRNSYVSSFTTKNNKNYNVNIAMSDDIYSYLGQDYDEEDIEYVPLDNDKKFKQYVHKNKQVPVWDVTFEDADLSPVGNGEKKSSFGITGSGDAVEVFSSVVNILRDFVTNHPAESKIIAFTASEPSRIKLYNRMSATLGSELGYSVFQYRDITSLATPTVYICYK